MVVLMAVKGHEGSSIFSCPSLRGTLGRGIDAFNSPTGSRNYVNQGLQRQQQQQHHHILCSM